MQFSNSKYFFQTPIVGLKASSYVKQLASTNEKQCCCSAYIREKGFCERSTPNAHYQEVIKKLKGVQVEKSEVRKQ